MNFASHAFFLFLPVVLLVYHLLRRRAHKYLFLLAASWFFYASWNPWFLWVLLAPTVVDYWSGRLIEASPTPGRRRIWVILSIVVNIGFLGVFKYTDFVVGNSLSLFRLFGWPAPDWTFHLLLPLGISFHTFQGITYTVDVYRGRIKAVRGFVDFALFVAFFPQLVAGPVVRAVDFLPQMDEPPRVTPRQVVEGLHWFVLGMFKKVFLADRLAQFVDAIFHNPGAYDASTLRWAVLAYAAQVYCDFSGYSDIAIGCAKWFGFELPRNFDFPYLSGTLADFWRRWHISLGTWLREYLYFPLGGNRRGELRTWFNLILAMTLCGLWHGANWNYVLWGLYNGVLLCLYRVYNRSLKGRAWADRVRGNLLYRVLAVPATLIQVLTGLVMVRTQHWAGCWRMEAALLGWCDALGSSAVPAWVPLLVGMVAAGHLIGGLWGRRSVLLDLPLSLRAAVYVAAVALLVVFGPGSTKAFIYFQF
jgi:alginate O-acetyltransferase complex protein AlgI